jgi:hypothetical protein
LKNRFKIIDEKQFHTYEAQVKLIFSCYIYHNWILGWGEENYFLQTIVHDKVNTCHNMEQGDNEA